VAGVYEVDKNSGGTVTGTKTYYPAGGAMRIGGTLYFMLNDHLGSASVLTDANGNPVSGADTRYYPFGEARFSTTPMLTDKLFTGQREITGLGIYYYGARFYSPYINRFLSADTVVPGYANPQNLNRYSYVNNNPLRYTDPSGHRPVEEQGGTHGCSNPKYCQNGKPKDNNKNKDKKDKGGSGGATPPPATSTPTPTTNPTLSSILTNAPSSLMLTPLPTSTPSPEYELGQAPSLTPTPSSTPIPHNDNKFPVKSFVPSALSWPPDFSPNADDIWNIVGNALPLINQPVVNSNTIVNSIVDGATNAINTASNTLFGYAGYLVSNGISPTIPILPYAPSTNPLAPVYQ